MQTRPGLARVEEREARLARIEEIEDQVYQTAAAVVEAALSFHEVDHNQQEPPPEWVEKYGLYAARKRLAVAKASWMPSSIAPVGPRLAVQFMAGVRRGRQFSAAQIVQNNLNVKIALPAPTSTEHPGPVVYPEKEIE